MTTDEICSRYEQLTAGAIDDRLNEMREMVTIRRLGGSNGFTGKIGVRASKKGQQRTYITLHKPELYDLIFVEADGETPDADERLADTK